MRILVTDGMDKTAMAQLREAGHEVVEQFYANPPFVLRLICKASIFPISNSSVANDYHFQPMVPSPFLNYGNYRPFLSDILMTFLFCR